MHQSYLNNRAYRPNLQNRLFPSLSATTTGMNIVSSSVPPSPDDVESILTASDSGTDSTSSMSIPTIGIGPDTPLDDPNISNMTTFGDLGGFKSYDEGNEYETEKMNSTGNDGIGWTCKKLLWLNSTSSPLTQTYPNMLNGQPDHTAISSGIIPGTDGNWQSSYTMQKLNNHYPYSNPDVNSPSIASVFSSITSPTSTSPIADHSTPTPTPPASSSSLSNFQFSFRMTPDIQTQTQTQSHASAPHNNTSKGRKIAPSASVSPSRTAANSPVSSSTSPGGTATSGSKPLTLQFNTRNGQAVLSLSTPAREAAAMRDKMKRERENRAGSLGAADPVMSGNEGMMAYGAGENGQTGSGSGSAKGKERSDMGVRDENLNWRNIKPAPPPPPPPATASGSVPPPISVTGSSYSPAFITSGPMQTQMMQIQQQPPSLPPHAQEYQNTYVPYDMYQDMVYGGTGNVMGQGSQPQVQAPVQTQINTQPQMQTMRSSSSSVKGPSRRQINNGRENGSQSSSLLRQQHHFQTQFQIGNSYPPTTTSSSVSSVQHQRQPSLESTFDSSMAATMPTSTMQQRQNPYPTSQGQNNLGSVSSSTPQIQFNNVLQSHSTHVDAPPTTTTQIRFQHESLHQHASSSTNSAPFRRPNGACTRCKRMKMKCVFPTVSSNGATGGGAGGLSTIPEGEVDLNIGPSSNPLPTSMACTRCVTANQPCIVEGRKPRTPSQREALLASLRQIDAVIATLLAPYQLSASEQNANIVLNGAKVVEALDKKEKEQDRVTDILESTSTTTMDPSSLPASGVMEALSSLGGSDISSSSSSKALEALKALGLDMAKIHSGSTSALDNNTIGPLERAALLASDKGGLTKGGLEGRLAQGKNKIGSRKRIGLTLPTNTNANSSDEDTASSDGSDSDDSEDEEIWDEEVERRLKEKIASITAVLGRSTSSATLIQGGEEDDGGSSRQRSVSISKSGYGPSRGTRPIRLGLENELMKHLHTLPPLDAPLGAIARLSLEGMGEKFKKKSKLRKKVGGDGVKVKIEGDLESVSPSSLAGQKRRREVDDTGDKYRDGVEDEELSDDNDNDDEEDEEEEDDDEKSLINGDYADGTDSGEETDTATPNRTRGTSKSSSLSAAPDVLSITLTDAQTLSLSKLAITESDGPAHRGYFAPGLVSNLSLRRVINARAPPPPILSSGLVNWDECMKLFDIYYKYVHPYCSVLDRVLHTPQTVYERDPFLFTAVLAVSSRYYTSRPELYKVAMHYAKAAAATSFVNGVKSIEMVQAYLLMCTYGLPARRWEEDRSWFYGGLAFRIATDLNLGRSFDEYKAESKMDSLTGPTNSLSERQEREKLNRMRTWLNCFNVDRSSSTQWGKPHVLREGELSRKAKEWWRCSLYNHPYDLHLVSYTELLRIVTRFHEQVYSDPMSKTGLNKNANFQKITDQIEADIKDWHDTTSWRYDHATTKTSFKSRSTSYSSSYPSPSPAPTPTSLSFNAMRASVAPSFTSVMSSRPSPPMADMESDPALIVRIEGVPVFENYMRLVMYSFGFEQAWRRWKRRRLRNDVKMNVDKLSLDTNMDLDLDGGDMFFAKCLQAASAVVRHLSDVYGPSGYLKYAPDCFFVMGGFCAAFLLKMLRPAFAPLLDKVQRERIIQVVTRFVDVLASPAASIDETHTPRLYAKFLKGSMRAVLGSGMDDCDVTKSRVSRQGQAGSQASTLKTQDQSQTQSSVLPLNRPMLSPSVSTTTVPTALASPSRAPPSSSFSHSHTPNGVEPRRSNSNGTVRREQDTMTTIVAGIDPALTVSTPPKEDSNSGMSSSSASSSTQSTVRNVPTSVAMSGSNINATGYTYSTSSRWSSLSQAQNGYPTTVMHNSGHSVSNSQQQQQPSNWPYAGDLGVGLGAAVMGGVDADIGNAYNEYGQGYSPQTYSQPHSHGSSSWNNASFNQPFQQTPNQSWSNQQQFMSYAPQKNSSSQQPFPTSSPLPPPAMTSMSMLSPSMDMTEDEFLATMHAISSDNWNSSVSMPGYGWGSDVDEDVGMSDT
ncbi:hypothetical protein Clacol_003310 [Clathrus columnatus]|uniref:Transcription factor domain-containing protein n=1 Tax=Clathrus columnatus TaxID=1419009 RepID=A0AAV5A8X4_9AGAM|nr:hypothetical protein Clacol_003310 [Clathrus columnatus]